jgi:MoaD family protein
MGETDTKTNEITVRVRFMGDLRPVVGRREAWVSLPEGSTVGDLMRSMSESYGEPFVSRVFTGTETLQHYILVFLNGRNIRDLGGLEARLGEGDVEIIMLPMFEGG